MIDRKSFVCEFCGTEYTANFYLDDTGPTEPVEVQFSKSHKTPGDCLKKLRAEIEEIRDPKRLYWSF